MTNDLTRREVLQLGGVAAVAAAAGCYTSDSGDAVLGPVGGTPGRTATRYGHLVVASDWIAASDTATDTATRPLLAVTTAGNTMTWGRGRFTVPNSNVEVSINEAANYAEAKQLVDRPPMLVVTTNGNTHLFTEDD